MVKKLHIKHKNAVFNGEASKWQAKEYMHDYRELMKWDARFYGLPLYKGTVHRGRKRWLNSSSYYRKITNSLVDTTYPKKQGKRKDEVLL